MYTEWKLEVYRFKHRRAVHVRIVRMCIKHEKPFVAWVGVQMHWPFMYYERQV